MVNRLIRFLQHTHQSRIQKVGDDAIVIDALVVRVQIQWDVSVQRGNPPAARLE
jgi:hypothetical protein